MPPQPMTIGMLARAAGVNVETVRYYQRRGLIATPPKALGGQRRYAETALKQITFIRRGQALGFTLDEIARLLNAAATNDCDVGRELADAKVAELRVRASELARVVKELKAILESYGDGRRKGHCPLIAHLNGDA